MKNEKFGEYIKSEIEKKGTRYAVYRETGIQQSTLQQWERGSKPATSLLKFIIHISETDEEIIENIKKIIEL